MFGDDGKQEFHTDAPREVCVASNTWLSQQYQKSQGKGKGPLKGKDKGKDKDTGKAAEDIPAATGQIGPAVPIGAASACAQVPPWKRAPF